MSTLTIMTQILTNYEKAGNHVTAVDIWLFVCLIMVFLALMEYAVAYTISHYYDGEVPGSPLPWTHPNFHQPDHKPLFGQTIDPAYKQDGDPFFPSSGPLRSNILRNSLRNRGNSANQQQQSTTPVVDFEPNNLFRLKSAPSPLGITNSTTDPESGNTSNELIVKGPS